MTGDALKNLFVVSTDIIGYTKLQEFEKPLAVQRLAKAVNECIRLLRAESVILLAAGDSIIVAIDDDDPRVAYNVAVGVSMSIAAENQRLKPGLQLNVALAIHHGAGRIVHDIRGAPDVLGDCVDTCTRVLSCVEHPQQILCSEAFHKQISGERDLLPTLHDIGDYAVKHGVVLRLWNIYSETDASFGCPKTPWKSKIERIRRYNVPELPGHYVVREEELKKARALLTGSDRTVGIVAADKARKVALSGMGGIGKSVLAAALAGDSEVLAASPDGVFWLTLGRECDVAARQAELARALGDPAPHFDTWTEGRARLSELTADGARLIVLDDVWDPWHGEAFGRLGKDCRVLITTRNAETLEKIGASEFSLDVLRPEEARDLLDKACGGASGGLPGEAREAAKECGRLPVALAALGALVRSGRADWREALERLKKADVDLLRARLPDYDYESVLAVLEVSVADLDETAREAFLDCAVFPEDAQIPEAALLTLWSDRIPDREKARDAAQLLTDRSLLRRTEGRRYRLHDLYCDYARAMTGDSPALHWRLLDAYRRRCPAGWPSGPDDGYFFQYLPHHFARAGKTDELRDLLIDFDWIKAKLDATDIRSVTADYRMEPVGGAGEELRLVKGALRLSTNALAFDKSRLPAQLRGRLRGFSHVRIKELLAKAARAPSGDWLDPVSSSLIPPGRGLLQTLEGHTSPVNSVAVTPDGSRVVSGSGDETVKVWDLENGELLRSLEGHTSHVNSVAVTPDGSRAVSGSKDNTVTVWDLESGELLRSLEGHTGGVTSVAVTPDGSRAISGSEDHTVKVWDLESGELLRSLEGHTSHVNSVAVTPDGSRVVSGSRDETVKVWDLESGIAAILSQQDPTRGADVDGDIDIDWDEILLLLKGYSSSVKAVAVTPDGTRAISGMAGGTLKVWDLESGEMIRSLEGHTQRVTSVAVSPDGSRVVSGSWDKTVKVWDWKSGELIANFFGDAGMTCVCFSDRTTIIAGSANGAVHILKLREPGRIEPD